MFERMEPLARKIVFDAASISTEVGANAVGTEHLLLALVEELPHLEEWGIDVGDLRAAAERNSDAALLRRLGISLEEIREQIEENLGPDAWERCRPFDPRAKKALELAVRAAGRLRHRQVGWQHLVVGLIEERGRAYELLVEQGVPVDDVLATMRQLTAA